MAPLPAAETRTSLAAPEHEPEVWDATVPAFNPHLANAPELPPVAVSPEFAAQKFVVEEYLAQERSKDLLRFSTAGSVDDGKSTLIGRLLYDTLSVYDDQLQSIEGKGTTAPGVLDLALLTDGLRAEREQGITIDVAYRYFSTAERKFIIADTPGHEQYTRNMATGASTADAAIILIDARKGVLVQSRRHAYISALLGVRNIIVAINKMDLVQYAEPVFNEIAAAFQAYFTAQNIPDIHKTVLHFVPVSALAGDNVVHRSSSMPWYHGESLLSLLESLPSLQCASEAPFRMAVQRVVRPDLDFRGFAGQIASGTLRSGDAVTVLPSGKRTRVKDIVTFDGNLQSASAPLSVTLTLGDELDISRGDVIAAETNPPNVASFFQASLVWMDISALDVSKRYVLKHMSRSVQAFVRQVHTVVDMTEDAVATRASSTLELNDIGEVSIEVLQPLTVDAYVDNRHTGSFVLIDPASNLTIAAGMIRAVHKGIEHRAVEQSAAVTSQEREARYGHGGAHLALGSQALLDALERSLFDQGAFVLTLPVNQAAFGKAIVASGVLSLTLSEGDERSVSITAPEQVRNFTLEAEGTGQSVIEILEYLRAMGLLAEGRFHE